MAVTDQDIADAILVEWTVRYGYADITYMQYQTIRDSHIQPIDADVYLSGEPWHYIQLDRQGYPSDDMARRVWLTDKGLARLKEILDGDNT